MLEAFNRVPRRENVKLDVTCVINFVSRALRLETVDHSGHDSIGLENFGPDYPDEPWKDVTWHAWNVAVMVDGCCTRFTITKVCYP